MKSLKSLSPSELIESSRDVKFLLEVIDKTEVYQKTGDMIVVLESGGEVQGSKSLEKIRETIIDKLKEELRGGGSKPAKGVGIISKIQSLLGAEAEGGRATVMEATYFVMSLQRVFVSALKAINTLSKNAEDTSKVEDIITTSLSEEKKEDGKKDYRKKLESLLEDTSYADQAFTNEAKWIKNYGGSTETIASEIAGMELSQLKANAKNIAEALNAAPKPSDLSYMVSSSRRSSRTPRGQDIDIGQVAKRAQKVMSRLGIRDEEAWKRFVVRIVQSVGDSSDIDKIFSEIPEG